MLFKNRLIDVAASDSRSRGMGTAEDLLLAAAEDFPLPQLCWLITSQLYHFARPPGQSIQRLCLTASLRFYACPNIYILQSCCFSYIGMWPRWEWCCTLLWNPCSHYLWQMDVYVASSVISISSLLAHAEHPQYKLSEEYKKRSFLCLRAGWHSITR